MDLEKKIEDSGLTPNLYVNIFYKENCTMEDINNVFKKNNIQFNLSLDEFEKLKKGEMINKPCDQNSIDILKKISTENNNFKTVENILSNNSCDPDCKYREIPLDVVKNELKILEDRVRWNILEKRYIHFLVLDSPRCCFSLEVIQGCEYNLEDNELVIIEEDDNVTSYKMKEDVANFIMEKFFEFKSSFY